MNKIKFSVVIPLYNKASHIIRTLESIRAQKHPASEIVIVDDGSTDNGPELIEQANYPNVRLIKQVNQGVSAARNTGISEASHENIAFLDADDQWLPLFLTEIAHLIVKFPKARFFGTSYQIIEAGNNYIDAKIKMPPADPEGTLIDDYFGIASQGDLPFTMSSICIKKSLFEDIGDFPIGEPIGEDQDLFCRAAINGKIAYSINIHSIYHKDAENQASRENIPKEECPFSERVTLAATNKELSIDKRKSMLRYSAAHLCHLARLNISAGRFHQARALLADPRCKLKPKHLIALYCYSWMKQGRYALNV